MTKLAIRLLASLVIAACAVYWLTRQGFDVLPSFATIKDNVTIAAVVGYLVLFSIFHILRAWRWRYLLRPFAKVPFGTMMQVAFLGFTAIQLMPLRTGEIARPYLLDRYAGISKSALFGTIAIERVVDGLLISLWLTAALFTIPGTRTPYVWGLRFVPLLIFVTALLLLIAFYHHPKLVKHLIEKIIGIVSARLAGFAVGVLERFHAGLAALPDKGSLFAFVIMSVFYWGINAVSFYVLALGCGLDLPFVGAVAGMGCLAVGILLPAGPGYFGNFQVAVLAALDMYIVSQVASGQGAQVFVFCLYVFQTGFTILFGAGGALGLRKRPVIHRDRAEVARYEE